MSDRHALGLKRGLLIVALGCCFVSFQAEVVAFYASGADRTRGPECGVWGLSFLEAAEFPGGVELARIAIFVLQIGERGLALFGSVEGGDDGPSRERRRRLDFVRDFGGVGRHHQIPAG